jgi:hypothetical protein
MKRRFINMASFLAVASISFASFNVNAQENIGILKLNKKLEKVKLTFEADYRHDEDAHRFKHKHYDFGVKIPLKNNWSTSVNYRLTYKFDSSTKKWKQEKRPHIALQKIIDTKYIEIGLRTRQEYAFASDDTESTRNRIRIMLKSNKRFLKLRPFIGNEFFYDFDKEKYNKNRFIAGVDLPKGKYGKYSLYYKYETSVDSDDKEFWSAKDSVVLVASFSF